MYSQTITPTTSEEYCPNVEYSFTFKVLGDYSNVFVYGTSWLAVTSREFPVYDGTSTTCLFKVKFNDISVDQVLSIRYGNGTTSNDVNFTFKKIKSIAADRIPPPIPYIDAPLCSATPKTVSFTKVKWVNNTSLPNTEFGEINNYQYAAPIGWKINGSTVTSTTDYKLADNKPTIEPNLLTGGQILVRPYNDCATGLRPGSWRDIIISRPALKPVINGSNSITINCEDTTVRTINITNATGLTCTTTYEWNLIGRNWSDIGGNPINRIITTTEPKLNIKPTFNGTEPKNIVVKIKAGTEELVDSVLVVNTNITPTISGDGVICSSATYNIATTSTINWSVSPSGIVNLSTIGNQATLTRIGTSNNQIKLTGTFIKCGSTTPITINKDIYIGAPAITTDYKPNYNYLNVDLIGDKGINIDIQGITSTLWERISSTNGGTFGGSGFSGFGHGPNYIWTVTCKIDATNQCGTTTIERLFCVPAPLPCDDKPILQKKATNIYSKVTLPCLTKNKEITAYKSAVLFDYQGNIIKQFNSGYDIDVNGIKPGIYILQMDLGKEKVVDKIIVE